MTTTTGSGSNAGYWRSNLAFMVFLILILLIFAIDY